ncbi:hypothetical protein F5B18DRAFT_344725 [Nemania serpens]|nr:hypothetical protein F5B18DRAFT_344725 [Nemania serpens]
MLSFRDRTNCKDSGPSESHRSLPRVAAISSSVRDRLRGFTRTIASRSIPRYNKNKTPYTPDPWYNEKSNDDLTCPARVNVQEVELGGRTWPAARKSISSTAPSLGPYVGVGSADSGRSPREAFDQYPSHRSKHNCKVPQVGARRWATMVTRAPPMAFRRSMSSARHSSFSSISEVLFRQDPEPAPQLPSLAESSGFLESLSKTGLFRNFTPLSEATNKAETIKVQSTAALEGDAFPNRTCSIAARLPLRLRNLDALHCRATGYSASKRIKINPESSQDKAFDSPTADKGTNTSQSDDSNPQERHKVSGEGKFYSVYSSHPVEWLDRVLETSYATRNPISPRLCVSKATMEYLRASKTCIFVEYPRLEKLPKPLKCYPGFRAALEDICDRFGDFYAPFAAYNGHTRTITLYASGTTRPEHRFVDTDTAIFNLALARSAWVRSNINHAMTNDATPKDASRETSEEPTDSFDHSETCTEGTLATDPEEEGGDENSEKIEKPRGWAALRASNDEDDAVDEDMASRLDFMG